METGWIRRDENSKLQAPTSRKTSSFKLQESLKLQASMGLRYLASGALALNEVRLVFHRAGQPLALEAWSLKFLSGLMLEV
jgi:hypothetical protein